MTHPRAYKQFLILIALLVLGGCASFGMAPAKSPQQQLAYAYGANSAALDAGTSALNAHTITSKQMEQIIALHNKTKAALDTARLAFANGDPLAQSKLSLALDALTALQTYERSQNVTAGGK